MKRIVVFAAAFVGGATAAAVAAYGLPRSEIVAPAETQRDAPPSPGRSPDWPFHLDHLRQPDGVVTDDPA